MRNYKFRGRSKKTGQWLYGDLVRNESGAFAIVPPFKINMHNELNEYEVEPETIGQFTGLCDIKGKGIYEGDILKGAWDTIFVVYFDEDYAQFRAKADISHREIDYYNKYEIVSNIHDDVELLK